MPKLGQPETPWRRVRFIPARKQSGLGGGGKVIAEVFLANEWHFIAFEMDGEGFKKLAALPERSRMLLLDSLACMPIRSNSLSMTGTKRPRGRNDKPSLIAWFTARTFGPPLFRWAKEAAAKATDTAYKSVLRVMKKEGCSDTSPEAVTTFLLEKNWLNAHTFNPERFPAWSRSATSQDPKKFMKQIFQLQTEAQRLLPDCPERVIANILTGDHVNKIYVVSDTDIESFFPMTDFRIY